MYVYIYTNICMFVFSLLLLCIFMYVYMRIYVHTYIHVDFEVGHAAVSPSPQEVRIHQQYVELGIAHVYSIPDGQDFACTGWRGSSQMNRNCYCIQGVSSNFVLKRSCAQAISKSVPPKHQLRKRLVEIFASAFVVIVGTFAACSWMVDVALFS